MIIKNEILYQTALERNFDPTLLNTLKNTSILITGACGMIGSCLIDYLMMLNTKQANIKIYAMGRSKEKAKKRFSSMFENDLFHFIEQDVENTFDFDHNITYIIHAASNANPTLYATKPVETICGNFIGMKNVLDFAKKKSVKRVVYISSGEMYGLSEDGMSSFTESFVGKVDYASSRACYPSGKRAAEVLCHSYYDEYKVDSIIVRPCHVYGPTMSETDTRAICAFIKNGVQGKDIVMKSKGEQIRSHCYVIDAITALLTALVKGKSNEAYNISADDSVFSIKDMAQMITDYCALDIMFDLPSEIEQKGFTKIPLAVLNNDKLKTLGWRSKYSLEDGLIETIRILRK